MTSPNTPIHDLRAAVLAYDAAIRSCANDPEKMASFCSAEGDDLDMLYAHMLNAAHAVESETATLEMARALTRAADFLEAHDKPTLARDCRVCADVLAVMEDKK